MAYNTNLKIFIFITFIAFILSISNFVNKKCINNKDIKIYKIAFIQPIGNSRIDYIRINLEKNLNKNINCKFDFFNAEGNQILLRSYCQKVISNKYDLIFVINSKTTAICKEIELSLNINIPLICILGSEKDLNCNLEINNDLNYYKNNIFFINDTQNFSFQIFQLEKIYKPNRIIAVYSNSTSDQIEQLESLCKTKKITLIKAKIQNISEIYSKCDSFLNDNFSEIILVLKDNLIISGINSLINLSKRRKKLLFVSDLTSFKSGATLAFSIEDKEISFLASKIAVLILKNNLESELISHNIFPKNFKTLINLKAFEKLKIKINCDELKKDKNIIFYNGENNV